MSHEILIAVLKAKLDLSLEVQSAIAVSHISNGPLLTTKQAVGAYPVILNEYIAIQGTLAARFAWQKKQSYVSVVSVYELADYSIYIEYSDGEFRLLDLGSCLEEPDFEPVPGNFTELAPHGNTIVWPNGTTVSPEWLYTNSRGL